MNIGNDLPAPPPASGLPMPARLPRLLPPPPLDPDWFSGLLLGSAPTLGSLSETEAEPEAKAGAETGRNLYLVEDVAEAAGAF